MKLFLLGLISVVTQLVLAAEPNYALVLRNYVKQRDGVYAYQQLAAQDRTHPQIIIERYQLFSQQWPRQGSAWLPQTIWRHELTIYLPVKVQYRQALLYVDGGDVRDHTGQEGFRAPREQLDYLALARRNHAPVVVLHDVPNQYLWCNGQWRHEDDLISCSFAKFLENPAAHAGLVAYLPMVKAVVKAMDASQEILSKHHGLKLDGFMLAGASKRGWTVWLTALLDSRVQALVPMVIPILNTGTVFRQICNSYGGLCPPALRDYQTLLKALDHNKANVAKLLRIIDPMAYLNHDPTNRYHQRLAIPKYIINASGDDFFVPGCAKREYARLPGGVNLLRYLPNAMHYFNGNFLSDSTKSVALINRDLDTYFYLWLHQTKLPKPTWQFKERMLQIVSPLRPHKIILWTAHNKMQRDFRFCAKHDSWSFLIKKVLSWFGVQLFDNCYQSKVVQFSCQKAPCVVKVAMPPVTQGWQASFAELYYQLAGRELVVTTAVHIAPEALPKLLRTPEL